MAEDARFDFPAVGKKLKKDGDPAHVQKWTGIKDARPLREHSYIVTVPTFTFKIRGEAVNSATQIRNMIANADERELVQILQDLYGRSDIPHDVVEIFKRKLGSDTVSENWEEENLFELLLEAELHREVLSETVSSKNNYNNFINKYETDATQLMDLSLIHISEPTRPY